RVSCSWSVSLLAGHVLAWRRELDSLYDSGGTIGFRPGTDAASMGQVGRDAGDGGISWDQGSHADGPAVEVPGWIAGWRSAGRRPSPLTRLLEPLGSWRDARTIGGRIYELEERGLPATLDQLTQWLTPAEP